MKYVKPWDKTKSDLQIELEFLRLMERVMNSSEEKNSRPLRRAHLIESDFEMAEKFQEKQRLKEISPKSLFQGSLYSILAAHESYGNQMRAFNLLCQAELDNPQNILNEPDTLRELVNYTNYPNQRAERITNFSRWWLGSDLPQKIINDSKNGKTLEFELRDQFAKEAYGIGLKTASLVLNTLDYINVVPVDRWVLRYLVANLLINHNPILRRHGQTGGVSNGMYRKCEKIIQNKAKESGVSPMIYQLAIWVAHSRSRGKMSPQKNIFEEK